MTDTTHKMIIGVVLHLTGQAIQGIAAGMAFKSGYPFVGAAMLIISVIVNWLYCFKWHGKNK